MRLKNEILIALVLWLAMAGVSAWGHFNLPDAPLAVHFGADGTANGFQPRDVALALQPGIGLAMIVLLLWLLPAIMPKNASIDRSAGVYGLVVLAALAFLAVLHGVTVLRAAGMAIDESRVALTGLGLLLVIMGNFLPKVRKNWLMGVRTPWTLSDERVWDKTHRFAGPLFMLSGLVVIAAAYLAPVDWRVPVILIAILGTAVTSWIYSYLVARKLKLA